MPRHRAPVQLTTLLAAAALAVIPAAGFAPLAAASGGAAPETQCPPGTVAGVTSPAERAKERSVADPAFRDLLGSLDGASADRAAVCRPVRQPEKFWELSAKEQERNVLSAGPMGFTPPGAVRAAVSAKAQAAVAASTVPGAQGTFTPLGTTPLISDDEEYDSVNGTGLADLAGRVDSFTYDPVNKRLFAAPGTGGIWLTTNLGESWRSVGDALPYQSVGAVTWSPDGRPADGTLLVISGEASAGGNVYTGMGAFYSTDSGATWQQARGIPDGLMGFEIAVDPTDAKVVYAATSQGLYRSADTGRTYQNVKLPTGDCAGVTGNDNICQHANWVTDVVVQAPGGVTDAEGGRVLAVVGYRAGTRPYPGTSMPQSPQNGLYRSDTGEVGSFEFVNGVGTYAPDDTSPVGFATRKRIGRTELGAATGPEQDHGYVYAIVQDAVLFNGGLHTLDAIDSSTAAPVPNNTALNGIYVSADFGDTWTRMADEFELQSPATESALVGLSQALLYAPGIQAWYNMWIHPDPTQADARGVPTRLAFGLEEVWESRVAGAPQNALQATEPLSFRVIGPYFADESCSRLSLGLPYCPTSNTYEGVTTTHPDQHAAIWVPQDGGGVAFVVGHDGGVNVQTLADGDQLAKDNWGRGANNGFHTLLPYDVAPSKDGTVWYGLQDNGSGKIQPDGKQLMTFGGDGFYVAVDPQDSAIAYSEHTLANMRVTQDGGRSWRTIAPSVTSPLFGNPFAMDLTNPEHLITAGPEVMERTSGPAGNWVQTFHLDSAEPPDNRTDVEKEVEPRVINQMSAIALHAGAAYVGFCSTCDIVNKDPEAGQVFTSGIATNVGGEEPPEPGTPAGWHFAAAKGLPDRYISGIAVDPVDQETVYVALAGYANRQWWPVGSFNDANPNVGQGHVYKSTDAGETFTDITGSLPDVPARSIQVNRGQLLVGTDVGMFLSSNTSGQRWAALEGLPNVPVTSIKNVPGNQEKVVLATFGRGAYEYTFSARAGAGTPVASPVLVQPAPSGGRLPATGLGLTAAAVGALALVGGLAIRRRTHA